MSEDSIKKLDIALSRIAKLEADGSRSRAAAVTQFDPKEFARSFTSDPIGTMTKMGISTDHVSRVMVAHTLGDNAPLELKAAVAMGPQMAHTQELQSQYENLSRQFSDFVGAQTKTSKRESFKALAADKAKYPGLAKALGNSANLYDEDIAGYGGSAEEFASREEARLKAMGFYAPPSVSEEDTDTTSQDHSKQIQPAVAALLNGEMPPIQKPKQGVFTAEEHERLKNEVVRKASSQSAQ